MNDRQRLEAIVDVVRIHLLPDGISTEDAMRLILWLVYPLPKQPEQEPVARFHVEHRTNACSEVCDIDRKVYATCAWSEGAGKRAQHICDLLNADLAKHKEQA